MMRTRRPGFTLVELLVVAVLGAVIIGAAYQSLVTQERASRATNQLIQSHDGLRAAIGILESELRETATQGGDTIGASDILVATADSIQFRAQRTLGFVCEVLPSDRRLAIWSPSSLVAVADGDPVLVFQQQDPTSGTPDRWLIARAQSVTASTVACPASPTGTAEQRMNLLGIDGASLGGSYLSLVQLGAPVRVLEKVTYGLYSFDGRWGLGRRSESGLDEMIVGLAGPGAGLTFTYLDSSRDTITAAPVDPTDIATVLITAVSAPRGGADTVRLSSTVFLRNN